MICPKCQHERTDQDDPSIPEYQCPACGIVYAKFKPVTDQDKLTKLVEAAQVKAEQKEKFNALIKKVLVNLLIFIICLVVILYFGSKIGIAGVFTFALAIYLAYVYVKTALQTPSKTTRNSGEQTEKPLSDTEQAISDWREDSELLWSGNVENVTFTYEASSGKVTTRTVTLKKLLISYNDDLYFEAFCHLRQDKRSFYIDSITSMINIGDKNFDVYDYIEDELGVITP